MQVSCAKENGKVGTFGGTNSEGIVRDTLEASIARGGTFSDEELGAALESKAALLAKNGF